MGPVALCGPILRTAGFSPPPQTEAPLLIRPYLADMTLSEIHAVMTGGFSTIAGSVMGAYISFGVSARELDPHAPCHRVLTCKNCPGLGDEGRPQQVPHGPFPRQDENRAATPTLSQRHLIQPHLCWPGQSPAALPGRRQCYGTLTLCPCTVSRANPTEPWDNTAQKDPLVGGL